MKNYKLNKMFQILFPFFFITGIFLIVLGFNDKVEKSISYEEDNSINYNVYLKKNSFFDTPYLPENRTYIASLIDYFDVDFNYKVKYNKKLTGKYTYNFVALVRANKKDSEGYYWQKEYNLSEEKTIDVKNNVNVNINDSVKVNYGKYNDILNKFKKEYGVSTNGELKIIMRVNNVSKFDKIEDPINLSSEMSISVPLLEQSLEVGVNKDTGSNKDIITFKEKSNRHAYLIYKITGFILLIISILGFINVTKANKIFKKNNLYEIELDKILKNYDSIIATVTNKPDIEGLRMIKINKFEELLDVYNEVRMPINYYQDRTNDESTFVIINESIAWIYVLNKHRFSKRVDNNEKKKNGDERK
ncbi:MAG: DUF5305 family protein [Bacilli bacterium]|nr:DUF5305 family protein [Bacilli bacterium]